MDLSRSVSTLHGKLVVCTWFIISVILLQNKDLDVFLDEQVVQMWSFRKNWPG
jgi:hypothetical protein